MSNVNVKLPYDIISIIGAHKNIENESKILIATELYREGEISSGKAAELADLPFEDFISELKNRKMKIYSLMGISEAKEEDNIAEKYLK
ncbi:MAG: putative antitoxin, contains HTH domain [Candidatus Methanomarinus sp.]|nr:MAG: putative antitoxin, contains HTH domain [ANME-2 cluster archaeon]KAF5427761.1 putative antitoxin, contains HTH domain [ANME-2 cluster archaeon]